MLNVGDLFSGIGGFSRGFDAAGCRTAFFCEYDARCRSVLKRHWPGVPRAHDIRRVPGAAIAVDVLTGGFPCQDLSVAGRRAGLAGERSGLFYEFARIAEEAQPQWIVIENVPGLLSSSGGRDMGALLGILADIGYHCAWRVLDAQWFGVAQRRRRVFIVGRLGDGHGPAQVLLEPEGVRRDPPTRREPPEVPPGGSPGGPRGYSVNGGLDLSGTFGTNAQGGLRTTDLDSVGAYIVESTHDVSPCLQEREGKGQDSDATRAMVTVAFRKMAHQGRDRSGETWGEADYANTLDAESNNTRTAHAVLSPDLAVRRLTPTECERLQGFPDGWTDGQPDSVRYRQLGNAVAVPVVAWLARRLVAYVAAERGAA